MAVSLYDNAYWPVDYNTDRLWPVGYWPVLTPYVPPEPPILPPTEIYTLFHTPATIVRQWLTDQALVTDPLLGQDWPAWVSNLPSEFDETLGVYDTTPVLERRTGLGPFRRQYGILLFLRARDSVTGRTKMNSFLDAMQNVQNQQVILNGSEYRIKTFVFTTAIYHLGVERDGERRHLFSLNLLATIVGLEDQQ